MAEDPRGPEEAVWLRAMKLSALSKYIVLSDYLLDV